MYSVVVYYVYKKLRNLQDLGKGLGGKGLTKARDVLEYWPLLQEKWGKPEHQNMEPALILSQTATCFLLVWKLFLKNSGMLVQEGEKGAYFWQKLKFCWSLSRDSQLKMSII